MGYRNIKKQKKLIFLFKLRILIFNVPGQRILPILQECPWKRAPLNLCSVDTECINKHSLFFSPTVANCGVIRWFWWFVKKTSFEILGSINLRILISISGMISYWALAFVTDLSWSARTRMRWGRWCFDGNLVSYWIGAIDIESEQLCNIATSYTASKQQSSYWSARCPLLGS